MYLDVVGALANLGPVYRGPYFNVEVIDRLRIRGDGSKLVVFLVDRCLPPLVKCAFDLGRLVE